MARKRTAHGRAAQLGATVVWDATPSDELRPAPEGAAAPVERDDAGRVTSAGAAELARMRWEAARMPDFAEQELERVPSAEFAPFDKARREYLSVRRQETHAKTGGVSAAVGATLRGEAWLTALGEYYATTAAATLDPKAADRALQFLTKASTERVKAWDTAVVEAESRAKANPASAHAAALEAFGRKPAGGAHGS